jgi:O-Antigen ligase
MREDGAMTSVGRRRLSGMDAAEVVHLVPAIGVFVVVVVLMFSSGGFHPTAWLPAGAALACLLVLAIVGGRRILPVGRPARLALLALIAFAAWNLLSVLWSDAPGDAWEASQLLLVTVLAAWTLALAPWRSWTADVAMLAYCVAAALVCVISLIGVLGESDLSDRFNDFRFNPPLDYANTSAAFAAAAAVLALVLASRPDRSPAFKAIAQGTASLLLPFALLPQSRGALVGVIGSVILVLALVPFRWRFALHAAALGLCVLAAKGPVLDVYTAASETGKASGAVRDAFTAILLSGVAGLLLGLVLAVGGSRLRLDARGHRRARLGGIAAVALVVVAGLAGAAAASDRISNAFDDQWHSLKHPGAKFEGSTEADTASRFDFIDPLERYDYWRVSLDGFRANPVAGMGAGGFQHRYSIERRYVKVSKYPHNFVMKVLGDNGIVGVLLVLAMLALIGRGLLAGARRLGVAERGAAAAAIGYAAYVFLHGELDWLEAYPVLTIPAAGFLFVALAVRDRSARLARLGTDPPAGASAPGPVPGARLTGLGRLAGAGVAVGAVLVIGSLLASWGALRYDDRAAETWRGRPAGAYADLRHAATLNPFATTPYVFKGVIAVTRGDDGLARGAFRDALDREDAWLPHLALGALAAEAGDRAGANREWDRAIAINRLDPIMGDLITAARKARTVDAATMVRKALASPLGPPDKLS